jgi:hypothetical protein
MNIRSNTTNAGLSGEGPLTSECKQDAPSRVRSRPLVGRRVLPPPIQPN